jgi:type II secretory pathway component PulC
MKKFVNRLFVALMVCALTGVVAMAEGTSKKVTFDEDVTVNGTLVKKGTYQVTFDEKSNELSIVKNKKTVAKATARLEKMSGKSSALFSARKEGDSLILTGVTMDGGNRAMINAGGGQATSTVQ